MENASKALIIAGSILIAIILIAVGVRIFNSTQGTTDSAEMNMDSTKISMFNNRFTEYAGKNISGVYVKTLVEKVIASNATSESMISITFDGTYNANAVAVRNVLYSISENNKYTVVIEYDKGDFAHTFEPTITGYIWHIRITTQS